MWQLDTIKLVESRALVDDIKSFLLYHLLTIYWVTQNLAVHIVTQMSLFVLLGQNEG